MNYLLDTNACIALINDKPPSVRLNFQKAVNSRAIVYVSTIAAFELWYGVAKSTRQESNKRRLEAFLAGPIYLLPFKEEDAQTAGQIRAMLEISGKPIGAYDLLMAGQAKRNNLTLVTANLTEFSRIRGLNWTDWGAS